MTFHARVTEGGDVIVPSTIAHALGLRPGDPVAIEARGSALILTAEAATPLARLRTAMAGYSVDQFLAERRDDWAE